MQWNEGPVRTWKQHVLTVVFGWLIALFALAFSHVVFGAAASFGAIVAASLLGGLMVGCLSWCYGLIDGRVVLQDDALVVTRFTPPYALARTRIAYQDIWSFQVRAPGGHSHGELLIRTKQGLQVRVGLSTKVSALEVRDWLDRKTKPSKKFVPGPGN